jgi:hypothetical protein
MKLYIWRATKIFIAFADCIEGARDVVFDYAEHMTTEEAEYVSGEPDQVEENSYAEVFPGE